MALMQHSNRPAHEREEWTEAQVPRWTPVSGSGTMSEPRQGVRQDLERPGDTGVGKVVVAVLSANRSSSIRLPRVREGQ